MHKDSGIENWMVRDVPEHTRLEVKLYALMRGLSVGAALAEITEQGRPAAEHGQALAQMGRLALEGARVSLSTSDDPGEPDKAWLIRDVAVSTHRTVKVYAAMNGLTTAEALEQMVGSYLQGSVDDQSETASGLPS